MHKRFIHLLRGMILILPLIAGLTIARAQGPLDRKLSVEFRQERLGHVLEILSHRGNFYFSYNSTILQKDSLVTLNAQDRSIRQILDLLFHGNFEYIESGNYIILRKAVVKASALIEPLPGEDGKYSISGVILDEETGEKVGQASVYDKQGLIATLSNENGFFTVRMKNRHGPASLTVSKEFYDDTTLLLPPGANERITVYISPAEFSRRMITVSPGDYLLPDSIRVETRSDSGKARISYWKKDPIQVELTPFGKFLLSSRLRIQTLNIGKFFTERPYQVSFLPMMSTNGPLNAQVTNTGSLNILGGYEAGLNGVEMGGLFNVDRKKVRGVQVAGLLNVVGGSVSGVQMAGLHNMVLDSLRGCQVAGLGNYNKKKLTGVQVAGLYNYLTDTLEGCQVGGMINFTQKNIQGVQVAGLVNIAGKEVRGGQIGGLVNYAHTLKGFQIGLLNIADSSDGYSIGLLNIVRKGYYEFSIYADEVSPLNFAFRSGNAKLYTILLAGFNPDNNNKSWHYGFGLGHRFALGRDWSLNPELSSEHLSAGAWENFRHSVYLNRLRLILNWRLGKYLSVSAGPSVVFCYSDHNYQVNGHFYSFPHEGYPGFTLSDKYTGWIGWHVGLNFF